MLNIVSGSPVIQTMYRYIAWWSVEQERKRAFQIRKYFTESPRLKLEMIYLKIILSCSTRLFERII
jgi:hypothetical protein